MTSLTTIADLRADLPHSFTPYGSKVRAFSSAEVHRDLLRIVRASRRDCSSVARWLIDEAIGKELLDGLGRGASVAGHKPGGPAVVLRMPHRVRNRYKQRARDQRCFQNSLSHFLGLALELGLRTRPVDEWIDFFTRAEDLVELIWRSIEAHRPLSLPMHSMCTR